MKFVSPVVEKKNHFCLAPFNQNCWFRHWLALISEAIALAVWCARSWQSDGPSGSGTATTMAWARVSLRPLAT